DAGGRPVHCRRGRTPGPARLLPPGARRRAGRQPAAREDAGRRAGPIPRRADRGSRRARPAADRPRIGRSGGRRGGGRLPPRHLPEGAVEVKGRMPWSSNATFLAELCLDGTVGLAVYKPERGERPLWDYPPGLWRREVAAYIVSETLDLGFVPETIERVDAPLG